jgi:hypothetical protein
MHGVRRRPQLVFSFSLRRAADQIARSRADLAGLLSDDQGSGRSRRGLTSGSFLLLLVLAFVAVSSANVGGTAYALTVPVVPVSLPVGISAGGLIAGAGEVATVAATGAEVAAGGAAVVAAAPGAVVAGAVLAVGGAVYLGIHWITGHDAHSQDSGGVASLTSTGSTSMGFPYGTYTVTSSQTSTTGSISASGGDSDTNRLFVYEMPSGAGPDGSVYAGNVFTFNPASMIAAGATSLQLRWPYGSSHVAGNVQLFGQTAPSGTAGTTPSYTTTPTSQCTSGGSVAGTPVTYSWGATSPGTWAIPACTGGSTRTGVTFPTTTTGTGSIVPVLGGWTAPTMPSTFSSCNPAGSCQLNLFRIGHGTTATQVSCSDGSCAGWQTLARPIGTSRTVYTATGTTTTEKTWTFPNGDTLDCLMGTFLMVTTECATVPTEPNTATPPTTGTDLCTTSPSVQACAPATGTTSDPGSDGSSCSGSWSWNPISWVLNPVKCALRWAFVPDATHLAQVNTLTSTAASKAPMGYVTAALTWVGTLVPDGSSCWVESVTIPHVASMTAIDTCTPGPVESKIMALRWLLSIAMFAGLFLPLAWWAWKAYAPGTTGMG